MQTQNCGSKIHNGVVETFEIAVFIFHINGKNFHPLRNIPICVFILQVSIAIVQTVKVNINIKILSSDHQKSLILLGSILQIPTFNESVQTQNHGFEIFNGMIEKCKIAVDNFHLKY